MKEIGKLMYMLAFRKEGLITIHVAPIQIGICVPCPILNDTELAKCSRSGID